MCKVYGYCRISTAKQNIERQVRNILSVYQDATIITEAYTGKRVQGRKEFERLLKVIRAGDTIVFDSVSRMSRNADEGVEVYVRLYNAGVNLVFLKEPFCNTETYKAAMRDIVPMTGTAVDLILSGVNAYLIELAKQQIRLAFGQAQKEVDDLSQRTKEGIETARRNDKQIGQQEGRKLNVKKAAAAKEIIRKHSKAFGGTLADDECQKLAGVSRNSYYKYKREVLAELAAEA